MSQNLEYIWTVYNKTEHSSTSLQPVYQHVNFLKYFYIYTYTKVIIQKRFGWKSERSS